MHTIQGSQRTTAVHTDSRITLEAIANPRNLQSLVESIRKEIRTLEEDGWIIHFTWVKAHNGNCGNEIADHLAKEAAFSTYVDTAYIKIQKSAVTSELKEKGVQTWQREWDASNKGELTKTFFPIVKERISKRLQMCINFSMIITGHGKLRTYFHRFKMIDDPTCLCKMALP